SWACIRAEDRNRSRQLARLFSCVDGIFCFIRSRASQEEFLNALRHFAIQSDRTVGANPARVKLIKRLGLGTALRLCLIFQTRSYARLLHARCAAAHSRGVFTFRSCRTKRRGTLIRLAAKALARPCREKSPAAIWHTTAGRARRGNINGKPAWPR